MIVERNTDDVKAIKKLQLMACIRNSIQLLTDAVPSGFLAVLQRTILFSSRMRFLAPDSSVTKVSSSTYVLGSNGFGSTPIILETLIMFICQEREINI